MKIWSQSLKVLLVEEMPPLYVPDAVDFWYFFLTHTGLHHNGAPNNECKFHSGDHIGTIHQSYSAISDSCEVPACAHCDNFHTCI